MRTEEIVLMHWEKLEPHPKNPRAEFPEEQVQEMAHSIAAQGVLQPLVCVPLKGGRARIVMGHMRWQGAKRLGEKAPLLPVRMVDWDEERQLLAMITENMARYNLDPVAEARYLKMLKEDVGMANDEISEATGLGIATIRNRLRLLRLPDQVQKLISEGKLPPSAATSLSQIKNDDEMVAFARKCAAEGIAVTEIDRAVRALPAGVKRSSKKCRRERHARPRKPKIIVATGILEGYEGTVRIGEISRSIEIVCKKCGEEGVICQQCPLTELVRLLILQPGVREVPEQGEYVEDDYEWAGLPRGMETMPGRTPGWREFK